MTASRNLGDAHNFWWQILWGAIIQPGLIKLSCFQLCAPGPLSFELFKYCDFTASDKHKGFYINSYLIVWPQSILLHWTGSFVVRILDIMNWPYRSLWPDGQWNAQKNKTTWMNLLSFHSLFRWNHLWHSQFCVNNHTSRKMRIANFMQNKTCTQ